jgi:hypothetical protein
MAIPTTKNKEGVFLTGYASMLDRIQQLQSPKVRDRIIKAGLGAGLNRIRTGIAKEAPKGSQSKSIRKGAKESDSYRKAITGEGENQDKPTIKKAIGRQIKKGGQGGVWFAKAGVNVGLKAGGPKRAPHGHLVALGTKDRFRKHIGGQFSYLDDAAQKNNDMLSTGTMPANDFVGRGYQKTIGKAMESLERRVEKKLDSELKRIEKTSKG